MENTAKLIKQLREENHMRQADFGRLVGVSDKAVWTWEQGRSVPSLDKLATLADHFGISIEYFVTGQKHNPDQTLLDKYKPLMEKIDQLTPEDRWKLEGRIDMLLEQGRSIDVSPEKAAI